MNLYQIKVHWGGISVDTFGTAKLLNFFEKCALTNWEESNREETARYSFRPKRYNDTDSMDS